MRKIQKFLHYFSKTELTLWCFSAFMIVISFILFDRENFITLAASLIGSTSLIFNAKGNPFGQILMIVFSIIYAVISFNFAYYGEMITYLGMTAPMSLFALISWLRNPYKGNKTEVTVNCLKSKEIFAMFILSAIITFIFYFILEAFDTANLKLSTISVTTSFLAVYLTFRRSPYFALAYASNDIILIILWTLATISDISYLSVTVCFAMFFINDLYGYISWQRMKKRQQKRNWSKYINRIKKQPLLPIKHKKHPSSDNKYLNRIIALYLHAKCYNSVLYDYSV